MEDQVKYTLLTVRYTTIPVDICPCKAGNNFSNGLEEKLASQSGSEYEQRHGELYEITG